MTNVHARRTTYAWLIVAGIAVLALSLVDMLLLDSDLYYVVLGAYALLFVVAWILMVGRRHAKETAAPDRPLPGPEWSGKDLRCPHCATVFRATGAAESNFSCPSCGVFSGLPKAGADRVSVPMPPGAVRASLYVCHRCRHRAVIETFGSHLNEVRFRACPNCRERGTVWLARPGTAAPEGTSAGAATGKDAASTPPPAKPVALAGSSGKPVAPAAPSTPRAPASPAVPTRAAA